MRYVECELSPLLERAGINRSELARRMGVTRGAVSKWKGRIPAYAYSYLVLLIAHNKLLVDTGTCTIEGCHRRRSS